MKLSMSLSSQGNILNSAHPSFRNFDYHSVHVAGAERIAKIAAECGVSNFVHVSHLNASKTSPSKFYQTKAVGEELVKAAFPSATIVRPTSMFGYEDKLLNNIAGNRITFSQPLFSPLIYIISVANLVEAKPWPDQDPPRSRKSEARKYLILYITSITCRYSMWHKPWKIWCRILVPRRPSICQALLT